MTMRTLPRGPVDTTVVALFTGSLTVMLAGAVALGQTYAGRGHPSPSPSPSPSAGASSKNVGHGSLASSMPSLSSSWGGTTIGSGASIGASVTAPSIGGSIR
jgi:hypothetical protein